MPKYQIWRGWSEATWSVACGGGLGEQRGWWSRLAIKWLGLTNSHISWFEKGSWAQNRLEKRGWAKNRQKASLGWTKNIGQKVCAGKRFGTEISKR